MRKGTFLLAGLFLGCAFEAPVVPTQAISPNVAPIGLPDPGLAQIKLRRRNPLAPHDPISNPATYDLDPYLAGETFKAKLTIEVSELSGSSDSQALINSVFPSYGTAMKDLRSTGLPSVELVSSTCKQLIDGIYARFELALERGEGGFTAKPVWIRALLDKALVEATTPARQRAAMRLAGALRLSGQSVTLPAPVQTLLENDLREFDQNPLVSKPLGFFSWTPELEQVFRRDRWLQTPSYMLPFKKPENLLSGLFIATLFDADTQSQYEETLNFYRRMTNRLSGFSPLDLMALASAPYGDIEKNPELQNAILAKISQDIRPAYQKYWALLSASTSPETELMDKLDREGTLTPETDSMSAFVSAIQKNEVSLKPASDAGFYAHQQYAMEALLKVRALAEGSKLNYGDRYLKRLEEAFKALLTQARETHIKQLEIYFPLPSTPPRPRFVVEPVPTYFERLAESFRFLRENVFPLFDSSFIQSAKVMTDGQEGKRTLAEQLTFAEELARGCAELAKAQIDLAPIADFEAADVAATWIKTLGKDDWDLDPRVVAPIRVFLDEQKRLMVQYWGIAGVRPEIVDVGGDGEVMGHGYHYSTHFSGGYYLLTEKTITFSRPAALPPLDRHEFRALLDQSSTLGQAIAKLGGS